MKMGFFSVLFLIFLTLKLTGAIAWSWVWITAPLWLPVVGFVVLFFAAISSAMKWHD